MADLEHNQNTEPYPKTTFSVDDILAEVRAMKAASASPAKPEAPPAALKPETAAQPASGGKPMHQKPDSPVAAAFGNKEKIDSFLKTGTTPPLSRSHSPSGPPPVLLDPDEGEKKNGAAPFAEEAFIPFGQRRARRPSHALTAEEVRSTAHGAEGFGIPRPAEDLYSAKPETKDAAENLSPAPHFAPSVSSGQEKAMKEPSHAEADVAEKVPAGIMQDETQLMHSRSDAYVPDDTRELTPPEGFRLTGAQESESEEDAAPTQDQPEEIDDYREIGDAPSISADLNDRYKRLCVRGVITGVCLLLLMALDFAHLFGLPLPDAVTPAGSPITYLAINLVLLLAALLANASTVFGGFFSLLRFKPDLDSAVGTATLAAFAQSVYMCFQPAQIASLAVSVYPTVAVLALLLNVFGKLSMMGRIKDNFRLVANMDIKRSVFVEEEEAAKRMAAGASILGDPVVACDRPTVNIKNYLYNSYAEDPADQISRIVAPLGLIGGLLAGLLLFFLTGNVSTAVAVFTGLICACVPAAAILSTNMPVSGACKMLREYDTMLCGYEAVDRLYGVNALAIDAQELFPAGSVQLFSIKTSGSLSIDQAILDAAAVAIYAGGPLADVFDKVIEGRRKLLPQVQSLSYEDDRGIVGTVSGRNILVGNRLLMTGHGVNGLPDIEYERRIIREGTWPVYMSCDGALTAMFVVKYVADEDAAENLYRLIEQGTTVLVRTCDPNINAEMLCKLFELPEGGVEILKASGAKTHETLSRPEDHADGVLTFTGGVAGLAAALTACIRLKGKLTFAVGIQAAGVIVAFALFLFFAVSGQLGMVSAAKVFLFEVVLSALCIVLPGLRKTF